MTASARSRRLARAEGVAPELKILALAGFVIAAVATPREQIGAFVALAVVVVAVGILAGVTPRHLVRRLLIEVPFVLFALAMPLVGTGPRVEVAGLSLSEAGLWGAWSILAKGTLGVAASVVLAATTRPADLVVGLERLHVPRTFTAIASFVIRYLDVVGEELRRLQVARISRGDDPRFLWQARATAHTVGTLFVRTYERGERVHTAMLSRGFDGSLPAVAPAPRTGRGIDAAVVVPVAAVGVAWLVAATAVLGGWSG